jgi:LysR family transcriptional regulator, transcriptional activator for aaeXAB operon
MSFQVRLEVAAELAAGKLVRVLPSWQLPSLSVDALLPARARQPARVRLAIEALERHLREPEARPSVRRRRESKVRGLIRSR